MHTNEHIDTYIHSFSIIRTLLTDTFSLSKLVVYLRFDLILIFTHIDKKLSPCNLYDFMLFLQHFDLMHYKLHCSFDLRIKFVWINDSIHMISQF